MEMENISVQELKKLVFINSDGLKELNLRGKQLSRVPDAVIRMTDVEVLDLSYNYLRGLPHDIYKLTKLVKMDVSHNSLEVLPEVIGRLENLKKLHMSLNLLTAISTGITNLEHLEELYLGSNSLEVLPEGICHLKNLKKLNMSRNKLTTISVSIAKLAHLEELYLGSNSLEVLPEVICQLKNLKKLNMSRNKLTKISANITKLELLEELYLSHNRLGEVPEVVCQLKNLKKLNISWNKLTAISANTTKLEHLQELNLMGNRLRVLPDVICELKNLKKLNMSRNKLKAISVKITKLKLLKELNLMGNRLRVLPEVICELKNMKKLNMARNKLTTISLKITQLKHLQELNLMGNRLMVVPEVICELKNLKKLNMSRNKLKAISVKITQLKHLQELNLMDNRLIVQPEVIYELKNLKKLNMSRNKLTAISVKITKLKLLQELALEGNSLGEVPEVICQLKNLKKLNMSRNKLTTISVDITNLEQLEELDLSHNSLEVLPEVIWQLKNLKKLNTTWNKLTIISANITKLEHLKELNLMGNRLRVLPEAICELKNLKKLNMSRNKLKAISANITNLEHLQELDLKGNSLEVLPEVICQLKHLTYLRLDGNPLKEPPVFICKQGLSAILTHLLDARSGTTRYHKLVLLGSSGAGKTSLAKTLMNNQSSCVQQEGRTTAVNRTAWEIEADGIIMNITITDFGGNHWYKEVLHLFLDENALVLLVVNLGRYAREIFNKEAGSWLNVLLSRVPKAQVLLVGTQIDRLENEERIRTKKMQVLQDVSCFVKKVSDQSDRFEDMVTVSSKTLQGIEDLRKHVLNFVLTNGQVIPSSWLEVYRDLENSEITRNQPFLTFKAVNDLIKGKWNEEGIKWLLNILLESKERRAETVLSFFHHVGALLWYEHSNELKKFVFHKAEFLVELMKDVFSERLSADSLTYQGSFKAQFTTVSFEEAKEDLLKKGIMSCNFLRCLWSHHHLEEELFDAVTKLLVHLDLCYPLNPGVCQSPLHFPWFLTQEAPETRSAQMMLYSRPPRGSHRLSLNYVYLVMCPEPLYHIFVARLHRHVLGIKGRHDWKDGLFALIQKTQVLVHRSHKATETVISVSAEGSDLLEVWTVLRSCHKELTGVMSEWPGIRWECWIVCPHCTRTGEKDHGRFPVSNLSEKCPYGEVTCPRHEERIPACLVYPVGDDFYRYNRFLEDYTTKLAKDELNLRSSQGFEQITSFKTDSPSQEVLSLLAEEVCSSWKSLGKQLCLADADLHRIEADNQVLYEQCYSMLKRWTQAQTSPPTYESLARALQSKLVGRGDLAAKYCSVSEAQESREVYSSIMDWSLKDGKPTDEEILSLAIDVQEVNWKQLGRGLKLKDAYLCEIDYDQRELSEKIHAMFSKWKKVRGEVATYRDLAEGLERVGRIDLIREFCCVPK